MNKEMTVTFSLTEEQQEKLLELHQEYTNYTFADGRQPFKNVTIEKMFATIMTIGSSHTINNHFDAFAWELSKKNSG